MADLIAFPFPDQMHIACGSRKRDSAEGSPRWGPAGLDGLNGFLSSRLPCSALPPCWLGSSSQSPGVLTTHRLRYQALVGSQMPPAPAARSPSPATPSQAAQAGPGMSSRGPAWFGRLGFGLGMGAWGRPDARGSQPIRSIPITIHETVRCSDSASHSAASLVIRGSQARSLTSLSGPPWPHSEMVLVGSVLVDSCTASARGTVGRHGRQPWAWMADESTRRGLQKA